MRVLPILFNTEMVRAILDGRKTVTRRLVKTQPQGCFEVHEEPLYIYDADDGLGMRNPPYQPGDILYARETWCKTYYHDYGKYFYRADGEEIDMPLITGGTIKYGKADGLRWRPSIHMPKKAARIWLKVTDVRVERLQDITTEQILREGSNTEAIRHYIKQMPDQTDEWIDAAHKVEFQQLWDSTIKKSDIDRYGWDANPWVWVIEFERCEKPEEKK